MKCNQFGIWTRVAVSNSYDDNHYTTGTSTICNICNKLLVLKRLSCSCRGQIAGRVLLVQRNPILPATWLGDWQLNSIQAYLMKRVSTRPEWNIKAVSEWMNHSLGVNSHQALGNREKYSYQPIQEGISISAPLCLHAACSFLR